MTFETYPINWLGWCYTPYIIPSKFWGDFAAYAIFTNPSKPIPLLSNMVKNIALMEGDVYQQNYREAQRVFKNQFNSRMNVKSSKRLVKQTKFWGHGNKYREPQLGKRDTSAFYHMIQNSIGKKWGPKGNHINVRALIGRWDPLGQNKVIKQWVQALPQLNGNVRIFEHNGHFIEEIQYKAIADAILALIK
jgi:hypothetical protein